MYISCDVISGTCIDQAIIVFEIVLLKVSILVELDYSKCSTIIQTLAWNKEEKK